MYSKIICYWLSKRIPWDKFESIKNVKPFSVISPRLICDNSEIKDKQTKKKKKSNELEIK